VARGAVGAAEVGREAALGSQKGALGQDFAHLCPSYAPSLAYAAPPADRGQPEQPETEDAERGRLGHRRQGVIASR
jgi:hypothetical protein